MELSEIEKIKIENGDFVLVLGKNAAGKTTLLKKLKEKFEKEGKKTGFVGQNFESSIIFENVWQELSFPLENEGKSSKEIQIRVAEICNYFGINSFLTKKTNELSGGEKQILCLAATIISNPEILILDESLSQLDKTSSQNFLLAVKKLNDEKGITVVIAEHNEEAVFLNAEKIIFLENHKCLFFGNKKTVLKQIIESKNEELKEFLPLSAKIYAFLQKENNKEIIEEEIPLSVKEAKLYLKKNSCVTDWSAERMRVAKQWSEAEARKAGPERSEGNARKKIILEAKNLSFKYEKNADFILSDLNFCAEEGGIFSIVGANGCGKSTFLKILRGILKADSGKIKMYNQKCVLLPQNVKNLFTKETLREELEECGFSDEKSIFFDEKLDEKTENLSFGEAQLLALEKVLLLDAKIILLDEPTKNLDCVFKKKLGLILRKLCADGKSIILVSHDLEFVSEFSDKTAFLFDGKILGEQKSFDFFKENAFYTTSFFRVFGNEFNEFIEENEKTFVKGGN